MLRCFPGYLFVEFDPETERCYPIIDTFGERGPLTNDGGPAPVLERLLDRLRQHLAVEGEAPTALGPGVPLEVVSGKSAAFLGLAAQDRIRVMLTTLAAGVGATLPATGARVVA